MKTLYFILAFSITALISCQKDDTDPYWSQNMPPKPEIVRFDVNDDSVDDFLTTYKNITWDGMTYYGDGILGSLVALNENAFLHKRHEPSLFIQANDTVPINPKEPFYWKKSSSISMVMITNSSENGFLWPRKWDIVSKLQMDTYLVAFKLKQGEDEKLGWLEFKIDSLEGSIELTAKQLTAQEYLVVQP